jgi:hypothetical protein
MDTEFIHRLLDKCRISAAAGITVVLVLGSPHGSSSISSYKLEHPHAYFHYFLKIPYHALPHGSPLGWHSLPAQSLSYDTTNQCFSQSHLSHPDFPPRDTFPVSPYPTNFILFNKDPRQVLWNLSHQDITDLSWSLLGSLAPPPPHESPVLIRPTRPSTTKHPRPSSCSLPLLYSHMGPNPIDQNPLRLPIAPLLCATWYNRGGMIPPNYTLADFLPPEIEDDPNPSRRLAMALHKFATDGIPGLPHPRFRNFPPGVLPSILLSFLSARAGVNHGAMAGVTASLAATSIRGHYRAELLKCSATASLLTAMGLPSPPFDPRPTGPSSNCEKCNNPATWLWIIRSEWTSKAPPPVPCETHPCVTLLRAAADTYIQNHKKRIGTVRGPLTIELRRKIHSNFLKTNPGANGGAAVCWSCALPTLLHRLSSPLLNSTACPPLPPSTSQSTLHLYLQRYLLVSIAGTHIQRSLLAFLKISLAPIPHTTPYRELQHFHPLTPFLRDPSDPSSTLIPLAATPTPNSHTASTHPQKLAPWSVWCVKPAQHSTKHRNGLPRPAPSKTPIPTGKYSLTNCCKDGTPRFVCVPFKEYLSATRTRPQNEMISPPLTPVRPPAQPPPPITEPSPQSNTLPASTHHNPTPNHPEKRTRLSGHDNPQTPPPALLPSKRAAPPHAGQFCPRCFAIGCHWVEACPETKQQIQPDDFRNLLQIARRAIKGHPNPNRRQRTNKKNANPPAVPMEIDPLPSISSVTALITEGAALVTIPTAPIAPGGNCEIDGCQSPAVGICEDRECQMRFCENHRDHMCEQRFTI